MIAPAEGFVKQNVLWDTDPRNIGRNPIFCQGYHS
jgi:hypothetical protein